MAVPEDGTIIVVDVHFFEVYDCSGWRRSGLPVSVGAEAGFCVFDK